VPQPDHVQGAEGVHGLGQRHADPVAAQERRELDDLGVHAASLVEDVLVSGGSLELGALELEVLLQLLLRLADVALVLEHDGEGVLHQVVLEAVDVEQRQRLRPVEGLADARHLLQVSFRMRWITDTTSPASRSPTPGTFSFTISSSWAFSGKS